MEQRKLQRRKLRVQGVAIHFGVNVDDQDFGHSCGKPK
jgi:hypothetical protein